MGRIEAENRACSGAAHSSVLALEGSVVRTRLSRSTASPRLFESAAASKMHPLMGGWRIAFYVCAREERAPDDT